eukprot:GDKI01040698.1.p1 GENE.GDKI01040698.1~~GDKI01040698.1.p1  ORF type:complete len:460 (+),score=26.18 GDKI01040698.1:154-1533(+)
MKVTFSVCMLLSLSLLLTPHTTHATMSNTGCVCAGSCGYSVDLFSGQWCKINSSDCSKSGCDCTFYDAWWPKTDFYWDYCGSYVPPCNVDNCYRCEDNNANRCSDCNSGYDLYTSGNCYKKCSSTCIDCYAGTCRSCPSGYTPSGNGCAEFICSVSGCSRCVDYDENRCASCDNGYDLAYDGYCYTGSSNNNNSDNDNVPCNSPCASCESGTSNTCTSCESGYYLSGDSCYENVTCNSPCNTCVSGTSDQCTSCVYGYTLNAYNNQCEKAPCYSPCASCESGTSYTCTACESGYYLSGSSCYNKESSDSGSSSDSSNLQTESTIPPDVLKCNDIVNGGSPASKEFADDLRSARLECAQIVGITEQDKQDLEFCVLPLCMQNNPSLVECMGDRYPSICKFYEHNAPSCCRIEGNTHPWATICHLGCADLTTRTSESPTVRVHVGIVSVFVLVVSMCFVGW